MQTGVHNFDASIAQGPGYDLGTTVMPVEARLGDHYPNGRCAHGKTPVLQTTGASVVTH